jgi:hypothetical protein
MTPAEEKARKKEIQGLREMVESDPRQCIEYPLDDARATLAVFLAQEKHGENAPMNGRGAPVGGWLQDQFRQTRAAFALHLSSAWGFRTDPAAVAIVRAQADADIARLSAELVAAGLVRENGSRDTKAAAARMVTVCREGGFPLRRTASHDPKVCPPDPEDPRKVCHVSLDSDACKSVDDELLEAYADLSEAKKVRSNDVEMLAGGVTYPISPRYDIAETGRTTCSKPNIQNLRRRVGIRECFKPRDGYVLAQADFPQLELYALAQWCWSILGFSKLGEALNAGLDPHLAMAANIVGISYEQAAAEIETDRVDNARQTAKVANFGFPGGLGVDKLILFAKKAYSVELTRESALALKATWLETWPEMPLFFDYMGKLVDEDTGEGTIESLFTKRFRGGARFCALCNSAFQKLGADCAKNAMWLVAHAQYVERLSPLFNARTVAFVHDELINEVRDDERASDAAEELARLMVKGANAFLPNVPIPMSKMKPLLMRRWSKKAKPKRDVNGRLVPWDGASAA